MKTYKHISEYLIAKTLQDLQDITNGFTTTIAGHVVTRSGDSFSIDIWNDFKYSEDEAHTFLLDSIEKQREEEKSYEAAFSLLMGESL